jgi:hypothetical protein
MDINLAPRLATTPTNYKGEDRLQPAGSYMIDQLMKVSLTQANDISGS